MVNENELLIKPRDVETAKGLTRCSQKACRQVREVESLPTRRQQSLPGYRQHLKREIVQQCEQGKPYEFSRKGR